MSMLTVRDLDPAVKAKLKERAARRGRSMEAEVRRLLTDAVMAQDDERSLADSVLDHFAGADLDGFEVPERARDAQRLVDL